VLLDLMMPDMSGLEVLKILKSDPHFRKIPVVMVTVSDEVETAAECILSGADDFITKPWDLPRFVSRMILKLWLKLCKRWWKRLNRCSPNLV